MNQQNIVRYFKTLAWPAIVLATYLIISMIFNVGAGLILWGNPHADAGCCISLALLGSSVITACLLLCYKPLDLAISYRKLGSDKRTAAVAFLAIVAGLQGFGILNDLLDWNNIMEETFNSMLGSVWGILAIALFGPICEEVVFRAGIIKPMLNAGASPMAAIITSAVVFGLIHGNPAQIFFAMLVGIVFGVVYTRTKSLIITTLGHIFNNTLSVILMLAYQGNEDEITATKIFGGTLTASIVLLVSICICFVLLRIVWKHTALPDSSSATTQIQ